MAKLDLTGQVFGRLTVVSEAEKKNTSIRWNCICSCGGSTITSSNNLKRGNTKSCGCYHKEQTSLSSALDITNRRFGRLIAISVIHKSSKGMMWNCVCDCGNQKVARVDSLTSGNTNSCGCIRAEAIAESNRIDITGHIFGKLTALHPIGKTTKNSIIWLCQCSCGNKTNGHIAKLRSGVKISCGCAKDDKEVYCSPHVRQKALEHFHNRRARKLSAGGTFTVVQIKELYAKQKGKCAWCKIKLGQSYHRDHRQALANGGDNTIRNIQLLCAPCNQRKNAKDEIDWAQSLGLLC